MKPNNYTAQQAAQQLGVTYASLRKQLYRDSKKPVKHRKYPNARLCECGSHWIVPQEDIDAHRGSMGQ